MSRASKPAREISIEIGRDEIAFLITRAVIGAPDLPPGFSAEAAMRHLAQVSPGMVRRFYKAADDVVRLIERSPGREIH